MNLETQLDVKVVERSQDPADPYPEARRWLEANAERNGFDPEVLGYPCTMVLRVEDAKGVLGYMPVQSAMFVESVALRANLSKVEGAQAMLNLGAAAERLAIDFGIRESYSLVTDEVTARAAIAVGYEVLPWQVIRKRLRPDAKGRV